MGGAYAPPASLTHWGATPGPPWVVRPPRHMSPLFNSRSIFPFPYPRSETPTPRGVARRGNALPPLVAGPWYARSGTVG